MAEQNQTLGSGRLMFDRFADGSKTPTGEFRYLGNTPAFNLSHSGDTLDHYDADHGPKTKDISVDTRSDDAGSFGTDDVSRENMAMWFRGEVLDTSVASASAQTWTKAVKLGRSYQIGQTIGSPQGVGQITITTLKIDTDTINAPGNWEVDLDRGLLTILDTATDIEDGDTIVVTYAVAAHTARQVVSRNMSIYGHLKFVADNAYGANRDCDMPYVKLSPDGDYDLKGDDWQTMNFTIEVLKLNSTTEKFYWKDVQAA